MAGEERRFQKRGLYEWAREISAMSLHVWEPREILSYPFT